MKTIIKLTLAAALAAGTFQASAQDDALARLRAQRAAEQAGSGQPAEAAPAPDATAAPAMTPAEAAPVDNANDPAARLRALRAAELSGGGQPAGNPTFNTTAPAATTTVETPAQVVDYTPSTSTSMVTSNGIIFNFRNAALSDVLTFMSDAAGYTILLNAPVNTRVTVISTRPMTKEKAVDVLNSVLNQSGLAAVVGDNDTLTIMSKNEAIHADIPIRQGNNYTNISKSAEIITQIIPIRFVDAQQLVVDISPFVSQQAVIVANQAGNSVIITDTQANIRHLMQIIASIDSSAEMQTSVQVIPLKFANPNDVVAMLSGVFPSSTGGAQTINIGGFGGFGGRGGGGGGGGRGGGGNTSQQRVQKAQQVSAVADGRTQSVVVTCASDMMDQIVEMIKKVDVRSDRDPEVQVVTLLNGDPYAVAQALQAQFGGTTQQRNQNTTSPLTTRSQQTMSTTGSGTTTTTGGGTTGGGRGGAGQ